MNNPTIDGVSRRICHACVTYPRDSYCPVCDPDPFVERQPLQVWEGAMPESNGRSNFTVILHTGDIFEGICVYRSEYPDRARYEADCFRHLIGDSEFPEKPFVCDYDSDKHSGYLKPQIEQPEVAALQSTIAQLEDKLNKSINLDFERRETIAQLQARIAELESEEPEWSAMQQRLGDENAQLRNRIAELESGMGERK